MIKPRFIQGILILLWGSQTEFLWISIPMALLLEGRYFFNRRWALEKNDFYRISDLVSLALLATMIYLVLNTKSTHFIILLVQWLPLIFYPLVLIYAYSTSEKMSLDVIFYSLRKQKEPVQQSWDLDYIYLGICLIAIGTFHNLEIWYFLLVALVLAFSLYPLRSIRYSLLSWITALLVTLGLAFATQFTLRESHLALKEKSAEWIASWIRNKTDPMRNTTALGRIGELKLSDTILFRVKVMEGSEVPELLQEAVYDLPSGRDWLILDANNKTLQHTDDFIWKFSFEDEKKRREGPDSQVSSKIDSATMYMEFTKEKALVPVPGGILELRDLPALDIQQNQYGTLQGIGLIPTPYFYVEYEKNHRINTPPKSSDLYFPQEYETLFAENVSTSQPMTATKALDYVREFFHGYTYSLYQPEDLRYQDPLEYFLKESKSGHCEYFASTTVLLLRYLGVPARYVTGYSVQEYDPYLEMYIVRERHAHAWAIAYLNGNWQTVDTTPAVWSGIEAATAGSFRPVIDFLSHRYFSFQRWWEVQKLDDYEIHLYILAIVLLIILAWRLYTSEQVVLDSSKSKLEQSLTQYESLPFYKIETLLTNSGLHRYRGELLSNWLSRIGQEELHPWVGIHYKWRFDPKGISQSDKEKFETQVNLWIMQRQNSL